MRTQIFCKTEDSERKNLNSTLSPCRGGPAETGTHEEAPRTWLPRRDVSSPAGACPGSSPLPGMWDLRLPFQVFQQEEEGDEVGVGQGAEQVHHAVFLGSRV